MVKTLVITPVKDSLRNTLETIQAIHNSEIEIQHIVYNDFSNKETKLSLQDNSTKLCYQLINIEEITNADLQSWVENRVGVDKINTMKDNLESQINSLPNDWNPIPNA